MKYDGYDSDLPALELGLDARDGDSNGAAPPGDAGHQVPMKFLNKFQSLIFRLTFLVGLVMLLSISTWAYFNVQVLSKNTYERVVSEADRLAETIKLGTHYAMMLNSREDINEIIKNIGRREGIENIRIYNKLGQIKFSNTPGEIDETTDIKAQACDICHHNDPPLDQVSLTGRTRFFETPKKSRHLGVISPIYNEPGCSSLECHVHPPDKNVLGALDVVISLDETEKEIRSYERWILVLAIIGFLVTSGIISAFLLLYVNRPIRKVIAWTQRIGQGQYDYKMNVEWEDEIGQLAHAVDRMGRKIGDKQQELNRQRLEYQHLFEQVPCYISVQDKNFRLLRYNQEFARQFDPHPGDHCYKVYKGRSDRCPVCPVSKTFADGQSHNSEETGATKDGQTSHWFVRTSPIRDAEGEVTAVMEMSLDITAMKRLEEKIRKSEAKYRVIFNNIPNPLFVLDRNTLNILDCNDSVEQVYGYAKDELVGRSFLDLFDRSEKERYALSLKTSDVLNQTRQTAKDGRTLFVNTRISPSEYLGQDALLVTTSDITRRLLAEQQLIQASKMATLGEMATGIAHELNQPLTVIKTASSFLVKKVRQEETIRENILKTLAEEIDGHVDRASNIINHLREFGRKADVRKERVNVNEPLEKVLDIFGQQLKLREIEVVKDLAPNLPTILADANRLEQVFINLVINARDAIEEKWERGDHQDAGKEIYLKTMIQAGKVTVMIVDNGAGIPESLKDRIFEPFYTTKKVGKGTGLGLSISYGIIQDYDGTITVDSTENEGSAFLIRFPIAGEVA